MVMGIIRNPITNPYTESTVVVSNSSALISMLKDSTKHGGPGVDLLSMAMAPNKNEKIESPTKTGQMASIQVVYKKDVVKDYSNQTTFEGTFFDSKPACTPLMADEVSFTLVTQASMDRLWIMKRRCQRWPPPLPISIAVYLPPDAPYDETHVTRELSVNQGCDLGG